MQSRLTNDLIEKILAADNKNKRMRNDITLEMVWSTAESLKDDPLWKRVPEEKRKEAIDAVLSEAGDVAYEATCQKLHKSKQPNTLQDYFAILDELDKNEQWLKVPEDMKKDILRFKMLSLDDHYFADKMDELYPPKRKRKVANKKPAAIKKK